MNKQTFFDDMWPLCVTAGVNTGVHPEIIFAQSALETGWGQHAPQDNYFGIKGVGNALTTTEFVRGMAERVVSRFSGYHSMADSVLGYSAFILRNPRYRAFTAPGSIAVQLAALAKSGYATDPNYINKLEPIINEIPALETRYHSLTGMVVRAFTTPLEAMPPAVGGVPQEKPMSDLSKFLNSNASVLNVAGDVIKGLVEFAPGVPSGVVTTVTDIVGALQQHATNSAALATGVVAAPVVTATVPPEVSAAVNTAMTDLTGAAAVAAISVGATPDTVVAAVNNVSAPHVDGPAAPAVATVLAAATTAATAPQATPISVATAVSAAAASVPQTLAQELKSFEGSLLQSAINDAKNLLPVVLHDFMGGGGTGAAEQDVFADLAGFARDAGADAAEAFQPVAVDPTKN